MFGLMSVKLSTKIVEFLAPWVGGSGPRMGPILPHMKNV